MKYSLECCGHGISSEYSSILKKQGVLHLKLKKITIAFLIIIIIISFCGCNSLNFKEFESIDYNGQTYQKNSLWSPVGKITNDKIKVYLLNYDSSIDRREAYYASKYSDDSDCVFLNFNNTVYTKENYDFPNIKKTDIIINKVVLTDVDDSKSYVLKDSNTINKFAVEYRNQNENFIRKKFYDPKEYDFELYINNYFAYYDGGRISEDNNGHLGFEDDTSKEYFVIREFSPYLEKLILSATK